MKFRDDKDKGRWRGDKQQKNKKYDHEKTRTKDYLRFWLFTRVDICRRKMPIMQFHMWSLWKDKYRWRKITDNNFSINSFFKKYPRLAENSNKTNKWKFLLLGSNFSIKKLVWTQNCLSYNFEIQKIFDIIFFPLNKTKSRAKFSSFLITNLLLRSNKLFTKLFLAICL